MMSSLHYVAKLFMLSAGILITKLHRLICVILNSRKPRNPRTERKN